MSEKVELSQIQEKLDKVNKRIKYAWLFSLLGAGLVIISYLFESFFSNARALEIIGIVMICTGVIVSIVYGAFQKNKLIKQLETKALNSRK